jgi:hypothetical protein
MLLAGNQATVYLSGTWIKIQGHKIIVLDVIT